MPDIERTIVTDIPPTDGRNLFVDDDPTADGRDVCSPAKSPSVDHRVAVTADGETTEADEDPGAPARSSARPRPGGRRVGSTSPARAD